MSMLRRAETDEIRQHLLRSRTLFKNGSEVSLDTELLGGLVTLNGLGKEEEKSMVETPIQEPVVAVHRTKRRYRRYREKYFEYREAIARFYGKLKKPRHQKLDSTSPTTIQESWHHNHHYYYYYYFPPQQSAAESHNEEPPLPYNDSTVSSTNVLELLAQHRH